MITRRCFACDRPLRGGAARALTSDGAQLVDVGSECFGLIADAGPAGYQPPSGGPRLYRLADAPPAAQAERARQRARL